MNDNAYRLLARLAQGPQQVIDLTKALATGLPELNALLRQWPPEVRALLVQQDGLWRLKKPLAVWEAADFADSPWRVQVRHECASSNTELLQRIKSQGAACHGEALLVSWQTQGRGRQQKVWRSPLGTSLTFSLAWRFPKNQAQISALPLAVAAALAQSLTNQGFEVALKWPNDLVCADKKLGGILIESLATPEGSMAVIGIGLNWRTPVWTKDDAVAERIAQTPIGLDELPCSLPQPTPLGCLKAVLQALHEALNQFSQTGFTGFQNAYRHFARDWGQPIALWRGDALIGEGVMQGVAANGALQLRTKTGVKEFVDGEVSLRQAARLPEAPIVFLDAGNSQLKWVLVKEGVMVQSDHAQYHRLERLSDFIALHAPTRIIGCAVCGPVKIALVDAALGHQPVTWLSSAREAAGIRNSYQNPSQHGADRWFNVLGARRFTPHACVVVSCGTAITLDALNSDNVYLGGSILPGFNLMQEALAQRTAHLRKPLGHPADFAVNTADALASGLSDAACGAVLLMWRRLKARESGPVDLILTGGGARKILAQLPTQDLDSAPKIVDNLVVYGLMRWVETE